MTHFATRDVTSLAFPHGTDRGYIRGCKCIGCRRGHYRANVERGERLATRGRYLVPSEPVREHVLALIEAAQLEYGEVAVIARSASVSVDLVHGLQRRDHPMMTRDCALRLLALAPDDLRTEATWVSAKVPIQQYRSLQALGWPGPVLADKLGYPGQQAPPWISQNRPVVHRRTADRMQALYDAIGGTFGPSEKSRDLARKRGWYTPLAYDDNGDLIPGAVREENNLADRRGRREEVEAMLDSPHPPSNAEIAERSGMTQRAVLRLKQARRKAEQAEVAS